ncbi:MAG: hypothetical protein AAGA48_34485 [Myxococcota bacterium]
MLWMAFAVAGAVEPQLEVLDGGMVRGKVAVSASADEVRTLVSAPIQLGKLTSKDSTVTVKPASEAKCRMVTIATPHPIMPVTYTSKDCDTAKGVTSKLVESKQLTHFEAEWKVEALGDKALITYDLDLKTNALVPGFIIRRSTRNAVRDALVALEKAFAK